MYKKLGILGGMGPLATYNLYKGIIDETVAEKDQDHIDMVILNASYIPDRTANIIGGGESPLPYLLDGIRTLENASCDIIAMPCNTAHYFYDELAKDCGVKILNMVDLTARRLVQENIAAVFLMATVGTIKSGIYEKYLRAGSIDIISANENETKFMMNVIYDIKAGKTADLSYITEMAEKYLKQGCEKFILGCTELSLIKCDIEKILGVNSDTLFIDSVDVLKDEILRLFGKKFLRITT